MTSGHENDDHHQGPEDRSKSAALSDSTVSGSVIQAGEIQGGVHFHATAHPAPRPRELLPPPADFTNRDAELAQLNRFVVESADTDAPLIAVVGGTGGVGKTALLLQWLHGRRADFPDGQFYVDLHGFSPVEPTPPSEVLGRFLRSLGVEPGKVPPGFEERAALFRSLTAGRRISILADNAISAAQVRALLPGPGGSLVAVTSRRAIHGLLHEGARFLDLRPLDERGATELLEKLIGHDRAHADLDAAHALTTLCGHLPIAIRALASRVARRRFRGLDRIVRELSDERRRIAALSSDEDITVRAVFDLSYASLDAPVAALYRRLGLLPGPTFTTAAVTALMDLDEDACEPLLDELVNVNLIEEIADGRYRLHDLIRLHAGEKAEQVDPEEECTERLRGVVAWYLARAAAADRAVMPGRWRIGPASETARRESPAFSSARDALESLEEELPNLLAVLRAANRAGFHELAWQICEALWGLFVSRRNYAEWVAAEEIGLASARACGDEVAQARMLVHLGRPLLELRELDRAEQCFSESLERARAAGHRLGEANAIHQLGVVRLAGDRPDEAIPYFTESRDLHAELGSPRGAALMTRRLGEAYRAGGHYPEAAAHLSEAIERFTGLDDRYNVVRSSAALAETYILAGDPQRALAPLGQAQEVARAEGAVYEEARAHLLRADAREALGDIPGARGELEDALPILVRLGSPQVDSVRARLRRLAGET